MMLSYGVEGTLNTRRIAHYSLVKNTTDVSAADVWGTPHRLRASFLEVFNTMILYPQLHIRCDQGINDICSMDPRNPSRRVELRPCPSAPKGWRDRGKGDN
jgi:hypothetical protein